MSGADQALRFDGAGGTDAEQAELAGGSSFGELLNGMRPGRQADEHITLFESQGMAIQDLTLATRLLEKAGRIIFAQHPPARISEDPAWFECRFCDHHAVCHDGGGAAVTCRSCLHSTPIEGGWHCARHDRMLAPAEQRVACTRHLFIPDLVPGEVIDAGDDVVTYRMADGSTWANDARTTEAAPC